MCSVNMYSINPRYQQHLVVVVAACWALPVVALFHGHIGQEEMFVVDHAAVNIAPAEVEAETHHVTVVAYVGAVWVVVVLLLLREKTVVMNVLLLAVVLAAVGAPNHESRHIAVVVEQWNNNFQEEVLVIEDVAAIVVVVVAARTPNIPVWNVDREAFVDAAADAAVENKPDNHRLHHHLT